MDCFVAGQCVPAGRVGKLFAYLRWASKEDLLADAMDRYGAHVEDVDTGDVELTSLLWE